jgi:hypothetical protein
MNSRKDSKSLLNFTLGIQGRRVSFGQDRMDGRAAEKKERGKKVVPGQRL